MSGGSEIKNVLTLDVSKFDSAIEKATGNLEALDKQLQNAGKATSDFEKRVADSASTSSSKFRLLDQTLASFVSRVGDVADKFESLNSRSNNASKGVEAFGVALKRATAINADQWLGKYNDELDKLSPALQATVASIIEFDRANIASADTAEKTAAKTAAAKLKSLAAERDGNMRIIAERQALIRELNTLQERMDNRADANAAIARRYFGKNHGAGEGYRQESLDAANASAAAAREALAVSAVIKELEWKNSEIEKTIALTNAEAAANEAKALAEKQASAAALAAKRAEKEASRAANEAAAESARAARQAANDRMAAARQAAEFERAQAQQIASMWKGMAGLWAASKIEHGFAASAKSADSFQREQMTLEGMNVPKEQIDYITKKAWDDSAVLKFASALDMVKGRIAMMGGMPNIGQSTINELLPQAAKAAHNIAFVTGDKSEGNFENMIRNISGVIEARGQTKNTEAAKRTIDLIQKIYLGTGRKIDISDLETFLRRDNLGANTITDEGLAKMVAFMDEAKVSGGHGGAGANGVSTVGTAVKMFQKMANGGKMTNQAAEIFASAGLIDPAAVSGKSGKARMTAATHAGLNVATLANTDPVAAMEAMATKLFAYMARPENVKRYFGKLDVNSEDGRRNAMRRLATETGWSVTSANMLVTAGDRDKMDRANAQSHKIMGAKGADELNADVMKTYGANVELFNKSLENLKITAGLELLPLLTKLTSALTHVIDAAQRFAKENKLSLDLTMIAAAAGGVVLAFKGFTSLMGLPGKLTTMISSLIPVIRGVGEEATATGIAVASSNKSWKSIPVSVDSVKTAYGNFANSVRNDVLATAIAHEQGVLTMAGGMKMLGKTVVGTAKMIGKGFLRMIPLLGEILIAWDFAKLLSHVKVGGHEIGEWMGKWLDDVVTLWDKAFLKIEEGWLRVKNVFSDQSAAISDVLKRQQELQKEKDQRNDANGFYKPRTALEEAAARMQHPDADPRTGKAWDVWSPKTAAATEPKSTKPAAGADATGNGFNLGNTGKPKREFEDLFNKTFEALAARAKEARLKIDAIIKGAGTYDEQAKASVFGKWAAGDLDKAHDPRYRNEFLKKGVRFDIKSGNYYDGQSRVSAEDAVDWNKKGKNGKSLRDMQNETAAILKLTDAEKALAFSKERSNSLSNEAKLSSERLVAGIPKETAAMSALRREFSRNEARNPAANSMLGQYAADKNNALLQRSIIDANDFAFGANKDAKSIMANSKDGELSRVDRINKQYDLLVEKLKESHARVIETLDNQMKMYGLDKDAYIAAQTAKANADAALNAKLVATEKQRSDALTSPLKSLQQQWANTKDNIDQLEASWGNNMMSGLEKILNGTVRTKKQIKAMLSGMLVSGLREAGNVLIKQSMGSLVGSAAHGLGDMVRGTSGALGSLLDSVGGTGAPGSSASKPMFTKDVDKAASSIKDALTGKDSKTSALSAMKDKMSGVWDDIKGMMGGLWDKISNGFSGFFKNLGPMFSGLIDWVGKAFSNLGGGGGASGGSGWGAVATWAASLFADGGIMTNKGPLPLKMYASGGVATSPQVAIFGEAGPEAYVPLPDGRSIPVTMKGHQSNNTDKSGENVVNISIVVNGADNSSSSKTDGNSSSAWSGAAEQIKAIVLQQIVAQQRPGGILYK